MPNPSFDKDELIDIGKWNKVAELIDAGYRAGALSILLRLAMDGCSPAFAAIAEIYEHGGGGVATDIDEAIKWYVRAIEARDDSVAYISLGRLYLEHGQNDEDYLKAHDYFLAIANDADPYSMGAFYGLGQLYELGLGVAKNAETALNYYQLAWEMGHALALRNIARITIKQNRCKGLAIWLKACYQIARVLYGSDQAIDPRLNIY